MQVCRAEREKAIVALVVAESTPLLPTLLEVWQDTLHWQPTPLQQEQFQRLYGLILAGNHQMNLTRITAPTEFWEKHLWDSLRAIAPLLSPNTHQLALSFAADQHIQGIDIGTGAGFPGVPVALSLQPIYPQIRFTLLDATQKKINFLQQIISLMDLDYLTAQVGRAEAIYLWPDAQAKYDLGLIRAVAKAEVCLAYVLPFLSTGGWAILYRGYWTTEEERALIKVTKKLGGKIEGIEAFKTPLSQSTRHCIYIQK